MAEDNIETKGEQTVNAIIQTGTADNLISNIIAGFTDKTRNRFAGSSLQYSRDNLDASKLLYAKLKALSIYHLQQSVEHLTKSYSYLILGVEVTRSFNHNNFSMLKALTEKFNNNSNAGLFSASIERLNSLQNVGAENIARMSEAEINEFITATEQLVKKSEVGIKAGLTDQALSLLVDQATEHIRDREEKARAKFRGMQKAREMIGQGGSDLFFAIMLGYLTYPHESFTRYPDRSITPEAYNGGNIGIVKAYDTIYSVVDRAITVSINNLFKKDQ